jgi:WD40 repeat protein
MVRVWDPDTGQQQAELSGHGGDVRAVAVSADGRRAVSRSDREETVLIWDLAKGRWVGSPGQQLRHWVSRWVVTSSRTTSMAVSANGRRAVSGGFDGTVQVWDLDTGRQQAKLSGHDPWVTSVAVSADGRRAVSGGDDGTVRIWDLEEGVEIALFTVDSKITELAVTPAFERVIAGVTTGPVNLLELCGYQS